MLIDNSKQDELNKTGFNPNVQNKDIEAKYSISSMIGFVLIGFLTLGLFPLCYHVSKKNWFNRMEIKINEMTANLDVQYEQRFETLTNIFNLTKKYLTHEKELLIEVTRARNVHTNKSDPSSIVNATNTIESALSRLLVTVEKYPEIKADNIITNAMESADYQAREVAATRRLYNSLVGQFNQALFTWPSKIQASKLKLRMKPLFIANEMARKIPIFEDK